MGHDTTGGEKNRVEAPDEVLRQVEGEFRFDAPLRRVFRDIPKCEEGITFLLISRSFLKPMREAL